MAVDAFPSNDDITQYDYFYKLALHRQVILEMGKTGQS